MMCSEARLAANRQNAQKSTGPRTAEGKKKSRSNALKHGLSGDGVVVPEADQAKVDALEAELTVEFRPSGPFEPILVRRIAVLAVRLDRCVEYDMAATARRVRNAGRDRDDRRRAEVAGLVAQLGTDPREATRRLVQTPEGVEALRDLWQDIRVGVEAGEPLPGLSDQVRALLGGRVVEPEDRELVGRCHAWERGAGGTGPEVAASILARADAEIEALEALRDEVDDDDEAADRAGAGDRALFDPSPEAERARKYEAAAERNLFRAVRLLRDRAPRSAPAPAPVSFPAPTPTFVAPPPPRRVAPAPAPVAPVVATPPRPAPPVGVEALPPEWRGGFGAALPSADLTLNVGRGGFPAQTNPTGRRPRLG